MRAAERPARVVSAWLLACLCAVTVGQISYPVDQLVCNSYYLTSDAAIIRIPTNWDGVQTYTRNMYCEYYLPYRAYSPPYSYYYCARIDIIHLNLAAGDTLTFYDYDEGIWLTLSESITTPISIYLNPVGSEDQFISFQSDGALEGTGVVMSVHSDRIGMCNNTAINMPVNNTLRLPFQMPWGYFRYTGGLNCQYLMKTAVGTRIVLQFIGFDTQDDTLTLYDGATTSAPIIAVLSGSSLPSMISGSSEALTAVFTSNANMNSNGLGFLGNWSTYTNGGSCSGAYSSSALSGSLSNPLVYDGISVYAGSTTCKWTIDVTGNADHVRLDFSAFSLQPGDSVNVYEGTSEAGSLLGSFNGVTSSSVRIYSEGPQVLVKFNAASSYVKGIFHGFTGSWRGVPYMPCNVTAPTFGAMGSLALPTGADPFNDDGLCAYTFVADVPWQRVALTFPGVTLAAGDAVNLYDGADTSAPFLGRWTGGIAPTTLTTVLSSSATIVLSLQQTAAPVGFTLNWQGSNSTAHCYMGMQQSGNGGVVQEPIEFDNSTRYLAGAKCQWLLTANVNEVVVLSFTDLELDVAGAYIQIFNGPSTVSQLIYDSRETASVLRLASSGTTMTVLFVSNASVSVSPLGVGFRADWVSTPVSLCSGTVNLGASTPGTFSVPTNPDRVMRYQPNANCGYLLDSGSASMSVLLTITFINSQASTDTVSVYSGSDNTGTLLNAYSGVYVTNGAVLASYGRYMFVQFTSDSAVEDFGFSFNYTTVPAIQPCVASSSLTVPGNFSSELPYAPYSRYQNNQRCQWLITAPVGERVVFVFRSYQFAYIGFYTGTRDNITLYDGSTTGSQQLYFGYSTLYAGSVATFVSSGNTMLVVFSTDGNSVSTGFDAYWYSGVGPTMCPGNFILQSGVAGTVQVPSVWGTVFTLAPNLNCSFLVMLNSSTDAPRIQFSFTQLNVYAGMYVNMYDGASVYDNVIASVASSSAPSAGVYSRTTWYSTGRVALVNIVTPSAPTIYRGFVLSWSATTAVPQCLAKTYATGFQPTGRIGVPLNYDGVSAQQLSSCVWTVAFDATKANQLRVNTTTFDFPSSGYYIRMQYQIDHDDAFYGDALTISDASYQSAYLAPSSSIVVPIYPLVTPGVARVKFLVDSYQNGGTGMSLNWEAIQVNPCGHEVYSGNSGSFASQYPADGSTRMLMNTNCSYLITTAAPNTQIRLYMDTFSMISSSYVKFFVYDGPNAQSPMLFNGTANFLSSWPANLITTGTSLFVTLQSGQYYSTSLTGFSARWVAGVIPGQCAGLVTGTGQGYIESPVPWDGANKYAFNLACQWLISPATGYTGVTIFFDALSNYGNDYLVIYDGPNTNAPQLFRQSGGTYMPLASTGSQMLVTFNSGGTAVGTGFHLSWYSVNQPPQCQSINFPANQAMGTLDYPPPWGQGFRYQSGLDCTWLLYTPGQRVQANLTQLSTRQGDFVYFYDGYHTGAPLLAKYDRHNTDYSTPIFTNPWTSTTEYMLIRFTSQLLSVPDYGFSIVYGPTTAPSSCAALNTQPDNECQYEGTFMTPVPYVSSGVPDLYSRSCNFVLQAKAGTSALNISLGLDTPYGSSMKMYDGPNASYPLLGSWGCYQHFSGQIFVSTQPYIFFQFVTWPGGSRLQVNWTAIGNTGPRNTGCVPIPIPQPPAPPPPPPADVAAVVSPPLSATAIALIVVFLLLTIIVAVGVLFFLYRRKKQKEREQYGDSTVRMDIAPDAVMKKRINTLLKQSSTKQIGKGGTAIVSKVNMEDGQWVAMKQLTDASVAAKAEFHREVTIFSRLTGKEHINVLRLVLFCSDPPVIVMELAEKGSVHRMRKEFPTMEVGMKKSILLQVAEGMRFLHENDIVHLDLKPENVLVAENNVFKISDFGTSLILGQDVAVDAMGLTVVNTFTGTPQYSSPERFIHGLAIDLKRADVFSFGVMAWSVATGEMPFEGETGDTVMSMHLSKDSKQLEQKFPIPNNLDEMLTDIIRRSIMMDFRLRPVFFDIVGTLRSDDLSAVPTINYSQAPPGFTTYNSAFSSNIMSTNSTDSAGSMGMNTFGTTLGGMNTMGSQNMGSQNLGSLDQFSSYVAPPPPPADAPGAPPPSTGSVTRPRGPSSAAPTTGPPRKDSSPIPPKPGRKGSEAPSPASRKGSEAPSPASRKGSEAGNNAPPVTADQLGDGRGSVKVNPFANKQARPMSIFNESGTTSNGSPPTPGPAGPQSLPPVDESPPSSNTSSMTGPTSTTPTGVSAMPSVAPTPAPGTPTGGPAPIGRQSGYNPFAKPKA